MIDQLEKSEKKTVHGKYAKFCCQFEFSELNSTLQNGFNMLGMMMQLTHQRNQNQQYNMHPQYQQPPNNVQGICHLQDHSHFNQG